MSIDHEVQRILDIVEELKEPKQKELDTDEVWGLYNAPRHYKQKK